MFASDGKRTRFPWNDVPPAGGFASVSPAVAAGGDTGDASVLTDGDGEGGGGRTVWRARATHSSFGGDGTERSGFLFDRGGTTVSAVSSGIVGDDGSVSGGEADTGSAGGVTTASWATTKGGATGDASGASGLATSM
jgi:hypothetical protein